MKHIKMYTFFLVLSISSIAHSMPVPYSDKEKAEECVRDPQATTKEQGQATPLDNSSNSSSNASNVSRN